MSKLLTMATHGDIEGMDKDKFESTATSAFMSLHIILVGAHSVANTTLEPIPPVQSDDPKIQQDMKEVADKVSDLQNKLDNAKMTAHLWLPQEGRLDSGLCGLLSSTIPRHLLDYGATYSAVSGEILNLLAEAKKSGSSPNLVGQALQLIGALLQQVQGYRTEMEAATKQLTDYTTRVQADHDALVGGADAIQTLIGIDKADAVSLQQTLDQLQSQLDEDTEDLRIAKAGVGMGIVILVFGLGLCCAPGGGLIGGVTAVVGAAGFIGSLSVELQLEAQIKALQDAIANDQKIKQELIQQAIALTALHGVVAHLIDQVTAAQRSLSQVSSFWDTLDQSLQSVMDGLSKPNADMSVVLDEVRVKAAQNHWDDLVEYAKYLLGMTVTVVFRPANAA